MLIFVVCSRFATFYLNFHFYFSKNRYSTTKFVKSSQSFSFFFRAPSGFSELNNRSQVFKAQASSFGISRYWSNKNEIKKRQKYAEANAQNITVNIYVYTIRLCMYSFGWHHEWVSFACVCLSLFRRVCAVCCVCVCVWVCDRARFIEKYVSDFTFRSNTFYAYMRSLKIDEIHVWQWVLL